MAKDKDAFICFPMFHVPRKSEDTLDATVCGADEDVMVLKDGATELMKCCGTQCHAKTFKIAKQGSAKTYEVTLTIQGK